MREAATLLMLLTIGALAGPTWRTRLGYAAVAFGVWDILYYVFLRMICGWPKSLFDWDVLFLLPLPWWGYVVVALALTHVTIAAVTIFLHRSQAHHGLDLHPAISHFFRFWLWLTTGMVTKEWVAIHRKHHARRKQADSIEWAAKKRSPSECVL